MLLENSVKLSVIFGVPQGSILRPLLFVLYINDLMSCCESNNMDNTNFILYADDTNIFVPEQIRYWGMSIPT